MGGQSRGIYQSGWIGGHVSDGHVMSAAEARKAAICAELGNLGRPMRGAEVGVYMGRLSRALLRAMPRMHLLMVDSWADPEDHPESYRRTGDIRAFARDNRRARAGAESATESVASRRTIMHMTSLDAAARVPDGSLDFVFIDAEHSYSGCSEDIAAWLAKLRRGGLLCGHDYSEEWPGVVRAVDEAVDAHGWVLRLGGNTCWFVRLS